MNIGAPRKSKAKKVLMLGSGELGKEVALEFARLGVEVVACDRYAHAPAMQVATRSHVFDMLDAQELRRVVLEERPNWIVPEIEAIATSELAALENEGFAVVPTAFAAKLTMDREGIRRLAAEELKVPTARYCFAESFQECEVAVRTLGFPCVVKPLMSSSGKGQSVVRSIEDLERCWDYSQTGGRTGPGRVIIEEFISFESEITLLTVRAANGTFFCDPIGHRQVEGDYVESWQPHHISSLQIEKAHDIAKKVTDRLGGLGVFGVELFLLKNGEVIFSEVSPRPHDTGMVTLATQDWSQFALHVRAILGFPIAEISRKWAGASVAVRAKGELANPVFKGVERVFEEPGVDLRIFGKPAAVLNRRLGVVLAIGISSGAALEKARRSADKIQLGDDA